MSKLKFICEECGKIFYDYLSNKTNNHIFCSVECSNIRQLPLPFGRSLLSKKDKISEIYNTNHHTIIRNLKRYKIPIRSKSESCKLINRDYLIGQVPWNKGKNHIVDNRIPHGRDASGWNGGVSNLHESIRKTNLYMNWRDLVFRRDNYTCQICGKNGNLLNVHHINSFIEILNKNNILSLEDIYYCDELWDINNGVTLCRSCHLKLHKGQIEGLRL
jgi:hypothetical protein